MTPSEISQLALSQAPAAAPVITSVAAAGGEVLRFRLSKDCTVEVAFNGEITQDAIDKLRAHLELSRDTYPLRYDRMDIATHGCSTGSIFLLAPGE